MMRRWIIRGFFLSLLLLCVTGWAWSMWYDASLIYWQHRQEKWGVYQGYNRAVVACFSERGFLTIGQGGGLTERAGGRNGWSYRQRLIDPEEEGPPDYSDWWKPTQWWNATYGPLSFGTNELTRSLRIPYWLLTLVCLVLLCLFWRRKVRPLNPATAFPVELGSICTSTGPEANRSRRDH